jgi:hypothetical protein
LEQHVLQTDDRRQAVEVLVQLTWVSEPPLRTSPFGPRDVGHERVERDAEPMHRVLALVEHDDGVRYDL